MTRRRGPAGAPAPVLTVGHHFGTQAINTALNTLLFVRGGHTDLFGYRNIDDLNAIATGNGPFYVTVMMNLVGWGASLTQARNGQWRPGHIALMLWDSSSFVYGSSTITYDPNARNATRLLQPEITSHHSFRPSQSLNVWFYTRAITRGQLDNMVRYIRRVNATARYDEFMGSRYSGSFNCATFVDSVLYNAGAASLFSTNLSWNSNLLSMLTPYAYSLSFSRFYWTCGYLYGRTTL